jgi:hypothetical protein
MIPDEVSYPAPRVEIMADTSSTSPTPVCCGLHDFSPGAGKPVVIGCMLCSQSTTYWALAENRESGQPYQPTPPLGAGPEASGVPWPDAR